MDGFRLGRHGRLGIGMLAVLAAVLFVVEATSAGEPASLVPASDALPERFRTVAPDITEDAGLDSIERPTLVEVFETEAGRLLVLTGSHDALESMLPPGSPGPEPAIDDEQAFSTDGWHYLVTRRPGEPTLSEVAMVHAPDEAAFPSVAARVASDPGRAEPLAIGDISALTNGVGSTTVSFATPAGDEALVVQRFPSARLDPVLDHFAPMATPTTLGSSPGYLLEGASGAPVLATEGPEGELVLVAGTGTELNESELVAVAQSAISR